MSKTSSNSQQVKLDAESLALVRRVQDASEIRPSIVQIVAKSIETYCEDFLSKLKTKPK